MTTPFAALHESANGTKLTNRSAFIGPSSGGGFGPLMTQSSHSGVTQGSTIRPGAGHE
jgi:hypothetical protein